ncbi:MAG: HD domain-containing protein [Candidatus Acidiferrales bacterium]
MINEKRIRDPIHGFIHFSEREEKIIDGQFFQRLRGIKQLALTCLVYPGAMHTRFEHSLGVMEMATLAFDSLAKREGAALKKNFKGAGLTVENARQLLRLTAIFHDTGHLPFSHAAEGILPKGKSHEDVSVQIVRECEVELRRLFGRDASTYISLLIQKNVIVPPELQILKKLISSQLDVDRADYLLRDSHHCGVEYGNFDYLRLFEMLRIIPGAEGGLELAIDRGGVHSLEALILARYYMFAQVYYHKVRRIYDIYLAKYMRHWAKNKFSHNLLAVSKYDDQHVHDSLLRDFRNGNGEKREMAHRILGRKHHKVVFETGDFAEPPDKRDIATLCAELQSRYLKALFILDLEARGTIHKFYVPGDEELGEEFKVISRFSQRPLAKESSVIAKLPKRFAVYRIYSEGTEVKLDRYREFSKKRWQELSEGR